MPPNLAKQRLKEGRLALGVGRRQARTVDIASAAAPCGCDWLFIDMEHNGMRVDAAAQIAAAAPAMGVTPIVRVPGHEHYHATRLLDNGAQGIVAPHVDDAAQARRIAEACLYRSEEHTSELQSRLHLVCRLLLEKKKKKETTYTTRHVNR